MRTPDGQSANGSVRVWNVPVERLAQWVREHPEKMHQASRDRFPETWRSLSYIAFWVSGGDLTDTLAQMRWAAVSLRDMRHADPAFPRLYREAEWEVVAEWCATDPPVNGDGLYEQEPLPPIVFYQFHGLPERVVMNVGDGVSFASYALDMLATGGVGSDQETSHKLSAMVNLLREREGLRPLDVSPRSGLLVELEDGSSVSLPEEVA